MDGAGAIEDNERFVREFVPFFPKLVVDRSQFGQIHLDLGNGLVETAERTRSFFEEQICRAYATFLLMRASERWPEWKKRLDDAGIDLLVPMAQAMAQA